MDVPTALRRIKRQFGDEYDVVITNDDIYGWIYESESDIIRTTGCNDTTVTVAANAFPTNIPTTVNVKRISINGKALQYIVKDELDLLGLSTIATGGPSFWYREKLTVVLWPSNASDTSLVSVAYNKTPVIMADPEEGNVFTVPEIYHDDVIKYCIGRAHNKNNNLQAEAAQMQMYDRNINIRRDEAQTADVTLYKIGDPMDFEAVEYN